MKPFFWLPFALMLGVGTVAQAQPPYGPVQGAYRAGPRVNPGAEAAATLREGMDKMLTFLGQDEKPNKLQVAAFLDGTIAPYFDFDYMAKWVAGPGYSSMSSEKRAALAASLEARFLGTLASRLAQYKGQRFDFSAPGGGRVVRLTCRSAYCALEATRPSSSSGCTFPRMGGRSMT